MAFQSDPLPPCDFIRSFAADDPRPIVAEWQAHVDAGRIGTRTPMAPDILASIRAAEALICRRRGGVW